jgi:site-specific recombinase XerD
MTIRCLPYGYRHFIQADQPMRIEREAYLAHLAGLGASYHYLKLVAGYLLHAVQIMEIRAPRKFTEEEVVLAGERWAIYNGPDRQRTPQPGGSAPFIRHTLQWFRFLNYLPAGLNHAFDDLLCQFEQAMVAERRLASLTIKNYRERLVVLLSWVRRRGLSLSAVSIRDIDDYLDDKRPVCCNATLAAYCQAMRTFFAWAEKRYLCPAGLPVGIKSPRYAKFLPGNRAPTWAQVQTLLRTVSGEDPLQLRARAIILLLSTYGLRSREVRELTLDDFDWINETFVVKRSKWGGMQRFPIEYKTGESIIRYLSRGRPKTDSRLLFVTHRGTIRPIGRAGMWYVVGKRMREVGINTKHVGPHALRHACATQLLRKGASMKEIADYLGHRNTACVGIYAQSDPQLLREVANFKLRGVR